MAFCIASYTGSLCISSEWTSSPSVKLHRGYLGLKMPPGPPLESGWKEENLRNSFFFFFVSYPCVTLGS